MAMSGTIPASRRLWVTTSPTVVDRPAFEPGKEFANIAVEGTERYFQKIAVRLGKSEHQRTFRAYRPGRVIFIFFAISECSGSMITTYPAQSSLRLAVPQSHAGSPFDDPVALAADLDNLLLAHNPLMPPPLSSSNSSSSQSRVPSPDLSHGEADLALPGSRSLSESATTRALIPSPTAIYRFESWQISLPLFSS